jgi:hypothetical protein
MHLNVRIILCMDACCNAYSLHYAAEGDVTLPPAPQMLRGTSRRRAGGRRGRGGHRGDITVSGGCRGMVFERHFGISWRLCLFVAEVLLYFIESAFMYAYKAMCYFPGVIENKAVDDSSIHELVENIRKDVVLPRSPLEGFGQYRNMGIA